MLFRTLLQQLMTAQIRVHDLDLSALEEAQQERIWAVVEAHQSGLSVRNIPAATGLSSSRVRQLLGSDEAREIPRWLGQRRRLALPEGPCDGRVEDLVSDIKGIVAGLKTFITEHDILRLPEPDHCQVIEMPEFQRGNYAGYLNPAPPLV